MSEHGKNLRFEPHLAAKPPSVRRSMFERAAPMFRTAKVGVGRREEMWRRTVVSRQDAEIAIAG